MGLTALQARQAPPHHFKDEHVHHDTQHQSHHHQGPPPSLLHRPSSIVQQSQTPQAPPHSSAYYPPAQATTQHQHDHNLSYYTQAAPQPSPYSTPGAAASQYTTSGTSSGYHSSDSENMMTATMSRPYPPMSYNTQQSNSPASPAGTDQQRTLYGQPPSQPYQPQSMYYAPPPQSQYSSAAQQYQQSSAPPQYQQHAQTSQPSMMMSQTSAPQQMGQHSAGQPGIAQSPRPKMDPQALSGRMPGPSGPAQSVPNGTQLPTPSGASNAAANGSAAPGPIPATTPLVVRQDASGVQWIAFEYSRDRVKMEYTIRCDVESVDQDALSEEFKRDNCVYPRACCSKEQYRGNRLQYETECNTVGWALAQLNLSLRGKRGLIQRAVDSWRNSNSDPRLRSRRVRRQAKMTKSSSNSKASTPSYHMTVPSVAGMGNPGGAMMGKPGLPNMGAAMQGSAPSGDEVGDDDDYIVDQQHHHHHQAPQSSGAEARPSQVFSSGYGSYQSGAPSHQSGSGMPPIHDALNSQGATNSAAARRGMSPGGSSKAHDEPEGLFPDIPEAKKRKFILVEDTDRQSRLRVRVSLDLVDTREIPDSFRKSNSVFPRSYFPREMQSPPPSATGSRFFMDDDDEDDKITNTEGERLDTAGGRKGRGSGSRVMVKVPMPDHQEHAEVVIPRMRKTMRGKEVRLNDLGYRMAWRNSRVFAAKTVFLQRALDCYRNKTKSAIENIMQDVKTAAPHFETRVGKRKWNERARLSEKKDDD